MTDDVQDRVATATRAARAGGEVAMERFRSDLAVERKDGKIDLVTGADRAAQRATVEAIREAFPAEPVIGEEDDGPAAVPDEGPAWLVDPIDGTNNFVREVPVWATSVAATVDGEAVAAANVMPALGDEYVAAVNGVERNGEPVSVSDRTDPETFQVSPTMWWPRERRGEYARATGVIVDRFGDLRRVGSAQATLSMVADGGLDGAVTNVAAHPWDTVAGVHLVRRAGGVVTDLAGERWRHDSVGLVASNGRAHDELLAAARAIDGD